MAKKIVKVSDKKETKSSLDLGKIADTIIENKEAVGKITEGISEILDGKKKTTKTTKKKSTKSDDGLSKVIDIAGTIFK